MPLAVEVRKGCARLLGAEIARPHSPRNDGRKLRGTKIADNQVIIQIAERLFGPVTEEVHGKQRNNNIDVKIDAHHSHSSRIRRTSAAASRRGIRCPTRRVASQSMASGVNGLAGAETGLSSTTGRPCLVITTPSPLRARSSNSDSRFLASTTLCWLMKDKIAIRWLFCNLPVAPTPPTNAFG